MRRYTMSKQSSVNRYRVHGPATRDMLLVHHSKAVQVAPVKIDVESAWNAALETEMCMIWFQVMLSISTCGAAQRRWVTRCYCFCWLWGSAPRQGRTLVHFSAQPDTFGVTESPSQLSRVPEMAVAHSWVTDGRIATLYFCVANLTVYLLESSDSKSVDRHLRYPE